METKSIYLNIDSKGNIDHCIVISNHINSELERAYEYSYIKNEFGRCHWCKRAGRHHFAIPSNEFPNALRAFVMLMGE